MTKYTVEQSHEYIITLEENGKNVGGYKGNTGNWHESVGYSWEPVFFESTSRELDEVLAKYIKGSFIEDQGF